MCDFDNSVKYSGSVTALILEFILLLTQVLELDRKRSRVLLTNKRSLVSSKYPIIATMDQCEPGMILEGFVSSVQQFGVFVMFYNRVQVHVSLTLVVLCSFWRLVIVCAFIRL